MANVGSGPGKPPQAAEDAVVERAAELATEVGFPLVVKPQANACAGPQTRKTS